MINFLKTRAHIFISGRVQGVFFRETAKKKADRFGVSGWVKNLKDGRVEAVLEGDEEKVGSLVKWAKRGPFFAKVNNLEFFKEDYKGEFSSFEIRYDL
ncbi:MAG: acylphosphatase [Candidatus Pacebacteria bacterium]|nr:acylphosphatase [Candidatus Paceibacterota bacterium]